MGNKRKKAFYVQAAKKSKKSHGNVMLPMGTGMKGFLVTYNSQFTFCLNEAKKILGQFLVKTNEVRYV